ncbi:MAG: cyclic nucleotide-binding domain-containing protein [Desulfosarcina sp.]|nr:cyclic nucleotide-binding domain-containing protein [Desulfosarcina sp.]MBC2744690.1 cyclic nucleotide-binding domain-containing protein [Desulfosarcina sp.]MBC2767599.1 cyclic nucleotide-binding domain-containing protein [Desulfosarcina sp.]
MNGIEQHANLDQGSIIEQILDNQIDINSVEEFENLLEVFPDHPDLHRKFADLLAGRKHPEAALVAYNKAAALYLDAGMVLQSIVTKILEWSIVKPSHKEGRDFHAMVRRKGSGDMPSQVLFSQLNYEEMVALMLRLTRVRLSPGEAVYDTDQEATDIYFIVSGELTETLPQRDDARPSTAIALAENDIFGDIFPLEEESFCRARVAATTAVELVKISKPVLKATCYRYLRIRELIERLSRIRTPQGSDRSWQTVRRTCRYCMPADVKLGFKPENTDKKRVIHGTIRDLSTGGVCVVLKNDTARSDFEALLKQKTTLTILEGNRTVINQLTGNVTWRKTVGGMTRPTHIVGIAFDPMAEETAIALNAFCTIINDEQDMIWNLWNHLVRH